MKMVVVRILAMFTLLSIAAFSARAHPHMFFTSTAQFLLDDEGRLAKLRVVFLIDELNTIYTMAELGVNKDGDQVFSDEDTQKIAKNVLEGFGHYRYFTHLAQQNIKVSLGKPLDLKIALHQNRLSLVFLLPLDKPLTLSGQSVSLQLYDPTYFTAITIDLPPMIVGSGPTCLVSVKKPSQTEQTRRSEYLLSKLSREETPDVEDVGAIFAETTRLECRE